jgi:O-antigen ligase
MIAGFLVMLFLLPFDTIRFKLHLPANLTPDRLLLVLMFGVVFARRISSGSGRRRRMTPIEIAVVTFVGVSLLSVALNIGRIYQDNQLGFVEKGLSQLVAYAAFFFIATATVRVPEMKHFGRLIMGLACLTSIGTIYESRTGYNVFYRWSAKLFAPLGSVAPSPTNIHPAFGRPVIVGPTQHALALASMLSIALPFAVLPLLDGNPPPRQRLKYLLVIGLILAACLATGEKTAMLAPIAAFTLLSVYKRRLLRWAPLAVIALIPVIHFAAPGALGGLKALNPFGNSNYADGRVGDYAAIAPDVLSNPILGRGYGTLDPTNWLWYRILDNQYLDELFMVGFLGLLTYLAIVVTAIKTASRVIRSGGVRAPPALAAAAGCAAYGLVSATYDAMGYPQSTYSFLFAAALIAIAAKGRASESRQFAKPRPAGPLFARFRRASHPSVGPTLT